MNPNESNIDDLDLALALRRLADTTVVPPVDPQREAALMKAFDTATRAAAPMRRPYWGMAALAAAAVVLIAAALTPVGTGRHGTPPDGVLATHKPLPSSVRGVQFEPPGEFVMVPGAAALPPMESGTLVRMNVPVSMLPSLGLMPPPGPAAAVRADVIVGQDGLTRAVRLVD